MPNDEMIIGVISDTHGLIRHQALEALSGSELIIHAGDVGKLEVLDALRSIAPIAAIRGNVDRGQWTNELPPSQIVEAGQIRIYVIHNIHDMQLDPREAGFAVVISGHSHRPGIYEKDGVLFLNPGSAGPRRFHLPISVALLSLKGNSASAQIIELAI
jgi:uncharacterized protein